MPAPPGLGRRLLALVVVSVFVTLVPAAMVNVVIPVIARDFRVTTGQASWVVTGNLLAVAVSVPLGGRAADVFGIRRSFLTALGVFAAGTAVCAAAPNLVVLVAGRAMQGVGEGLLPALAVVTVGRTLPAGRRGPALGLVFAGAGVGATIGPLVGGLAQEAVGWRAPFVGILFAALLLVPPAVRLLPDLRVPGERHIDLAGGLLMGLAAGAGLLAVTTAEHTGFGAPPVLAMAAVCAVALPLLVRRLRTARHPLVRPGLFANRRFTGAAVIGFTAQGANVTISVLVPLVLTQTGGFSPGQVAGVLAPGPVAAAVVSPLAGRLSDRLGPRPLVGTGLALMLGAALLLATVDAGASPVPAAAGVLLLGAGFGLVNAPTTNLVVRSVDPAEAGAGVGVYQSAYFLGGAVGPVLAGFVVAGRQEARGGPWNPLAPGLAGPGAAYSDAFLLLALPLVLALLTLPAVAGARETEDARDDGDAGGIARAVRAGAKSRPAGPGTALRTGGAPRSGEASRAGGEIRTGGMPRTGEVPWSGEAPRTGGAGGPDLPAGGTRADGGTGPPRILRTTVRDVPGWAVVKSTERDRTPGGPPGNGVASRRLAGGR